MKRLLLCSLGFVSFAFGQTTETVSLGAGYANESYYSFSNGEISNIGNSDWDLAFDLSAWGSAIRLNKKNATLYVYPGVSTDWAILDTTGMGTWDTYLNGYDWWEEGALNNAADPNDDFDLGWGVYNPITHQINGSRIFVLEFSGDYRKLMVESLSGGVYTFKTAEIDGSGEVTNSITKSDYTDRNFVYYDVLGNQVLNREPDNTAWDIVFTNYVLELGPGYYGGVTSVLHNNGVTVSEISGVPVSAANYSTWDTTIAAIGYDWKSFNMTTFQYDIVDSLCYFVQTSEGDIWKMVFTGFEGSSTGNIHFTKEQVESAGVPLYEGANLVIAPNPAGNMVQLNYTNELQEVQVMDVNGHVALRKRIQGGMSETINTSGLNEGIYFIHVTDTQGRTATEKMMIQH